MAVNEASVDGGLLGEKVCAAQDVPGLLVVEVRFDEPEEFRLSLI